MPTDTDTIIMPNGTACAVLGRPNQVLAAFVAHFRREPEPGNQHDDACLLQLRLFIERYGRAPDTRKKSDLALLQQIELDTAPDPVLNAIHGPDGKRLDELEVEMMKHPAPERPLVHRFTPGLYIRELSTPAGTLSVSKIHKTEHPFTISKGRVAIRIDGGEWIIVAAPYTGITKPGTRRVSYFLEDTVWTTYHVTDLTDVDAIEAEIIEKHDEHRAGLSQPLAPVLLGANP